MSDFIKLTDARWVFGSGPGHEHYEPGGPLYLKGEIIKVIRPGIRVTELLLSSPTEHAIWLLCMESVEAVHELCRQSAQAASPDLWQEGLADLSALKDLNRALVEAVQAWQSVAIGFNARLLEQSRSLDRKPTDTEIVGWLDGEMDRADTLGEAALAMVAKREERV